MVPGQMTRAELMRERPSPTKREDPGWTEGQKRPSLDRERDCCEDMCTPHYDHI